jgi:parallel beta-helix repeat protein
LSLGNFTFSYNTNYTIVVNTHLPNGVADQDNNNDTLTFNGVSNGLNGTYTVGGSSADFANLQAAAAALANGICGPVVFNFDSAAGPYIADVQIGVIIGGSSTNTVTFNGNGAILNEGITTSFFDLVGASHITINNFKMVAVDQNSTLFAILLRNQAEHITISNNTIDMGVASTSTNRNGICATNSTTSWGNAGNNARYITIDNNKINGAYSAIRLNGSSSYLNGFGHVISNNIITDFYVYGIYLMDSDSTIVHNNNISRPNRTTTYYGIYGLRARNTKITNNKVHTTTTTSVCYGIWVNTSQNTVGFETEIVNNLIYGLNTTSTAYPLYLSGTRDRMNIYHNTVDMDGSFNGTKRAFFLNGAPNNHAVRNNIFTLRGTGGTGAKHLIYASTTSASFSSNNNVYHIETTSGTNRVGFWTADRITLNDWQTASSQDANAVSANPNYLNAANGVFIPLSTTIDDIGANVGVTTDIAGSTRSTTSPDAGCYEFTGANEDLALISASLINSLCYSNNDTLELILENSFGSSVDFSLNPVNIGWSVQGPVNSSGTQAINSGTLALNAFDTIRIAGIDLSQPGNYAYSLWIDSGLVNQTTLNDSLMNQTFKVDSLIRAEPKYTLINSTVDSVILEAKSPLFVSTVSYNIDVANLLNVPTNSAGLTYYGSSNQGFQWTDNLPAGAVITNVTLEFKIGVECNTAPSTRTTSLNSVAQASFTSSTYHCSTTSPGPASFVTINLNPANYNVGSNNVFAVTNGGTFGFERTALLNNNFARITVEYSSGTGSFEWELNSATYDTNTTIVVGPYTSNGIYDYVAELVLGCGTYRDTGRVEVVLPGDDAGISQLVSPVNNGSCSGTQNVEVRVSNFGTNVLSSVNINWILDATPQTPLNITGMNIQPGADTVIVLGTMSLSAISTSSIVAWTSNPNAAVDANAANDTLTANNITALLGGATYTIGASGNFTSFSNALTKLYQGVCGPVVFDVANGTYTEQVTIDTVPNVSSTNTVTFRSASGDSTSVVLQHAANAANFNWTLRLNGADYIRFERMTLRATGTTWGRVVEFINEADNNEITNCVIETNTTSTSSNFSGVWAANTSLNHNNRIANNRFMGGYYGVYFYGINTGVTQRNIGLIVENNDFVDYYFYGVYVYFADAAIINNNRFTNRSNVNTLYPVYVFYSYNSTQVANNVIHSTNNGANTYNGIYLFQVQGTTSQKALVANNVIAHTGTSTGTTYGLYTNGCSHVNILHNTVFLNNNPSTIGNSRAFFNSSGSSLTSINNIYHNQSGGYAFYTSSTTAFTTTDFNNFYTTGTNVAFWGTNRTTLAVLQANNGSRDQNSISEESKFIGATFIPEYPYALSDVSACIDAGTNTLPVTLSNDLRGSARILSGGAATPTADMGAIEYILGEWNWEWTGAVNTVWSVGGNWNRGTPPGVNQTASISSVPTNQPLVATSESINRLIVQSGASVTINAFSSLTVEDTIVNNGTITVEHTGSLIQTHAGTNNNTGNGTYVIKKTGNQQANRYNVWSSPVVDTIKVWNVFTGTNPCDVYVFEPSTQSWKWPYPSGYQTTCMSSNVTFSAAHVLTGMNGSMWAGRGYYVPGNGTQATRTFNGNVNNGTITTPVALGPNPTSAPWSGSNWNLIGNPYPSSINANSFWQENAVNNTRVSGALYFWNDNGTGSNYSENDYASWNTMGGVQGPNGGATPNGHIASGQGFWVIANSNTNVSFNNSMRSSVNNQFFGATETFPRIWIDVAFDTLVKSQALIAFPEDGTNEHDALYDAPKLQSSQQVYLASRITTQDLVIQALEPLKFTSSRKRVPLTFKTQLQGVHRIEMFNQDNMDRIAVYLHDAENDSLHPIQGSSYVFTPDSVGEYKERFALWFMHRDLDEHVGEIGITPGVDNPSTGIANANEERGFKVIARNEQIVVKSKGSSRIKHIVLTDMQGRTIREGDGKNGVRYELNTGRIATAVYFVRITDERGELSVEKVFIK